MMRVRYQVQVISEQIASQQWSITEWGVESDREEAMKRCDRLRRSWLKRKVKPQGCRRYFNVVPLVDID